MAMAVKLVRWLMAVAMIIVFVTLAMELVGALTMIHLEFGVQGCSSDGEGLGEDEGEIQWRQ